MGLTFVLFFPPPTLNIYFRNILYHSEQITANLNFSDITSVTLKLISDFEIS